MKGGQPTLSRQTVEVCVFDLTKIQKALPNPTPSSNRHSRFYDGSPTFGAPSSLLPVKKRIKVSLPCPHTPERFRDLPRRLTVRPESDLQDAPSPKILDRSKTKRFKVICRSEIASLPSPTLQDSELRTAAPFPANSNNESLALSNSNHPNTLGDGRSSTDGIFLHSYGDSNPSQTRLEENSRSNSRQIVSAEDTGDFVDDLLKSLKQLRLQRTRDEV
jgi:hypothetical protein